MTICYFQTLSLPPDGGLRDGPETGRKFRQKAVPELLGRPEISAISVFTPEPVSDPCLEKAACADDEASPALVVELILPDTASLNRLLGMPAALAALSPPQGAMVTCDVFEAMSFGLAAGRQAPRRVAPISYDVRYFPPAGNDDWQDTDSFIGHYLKSHLPILRELPLIRNILCYLPVPWKHPAGMEKSGCILGNEVVFDTFETLDAALASEVRHRLRRDFTAFPIKPGHDTHHAMRREDFYRNPARIFL